MSLDEVGFERSDALPPAAAPASAPAAPALEAVDLHRHYRVARGLFDSARVRALNGVTFSVARGRTLAVVGESGCGKSTLARVLTLIEPPTRGEVRIEGRPTEVPPEAAQRRRVQMVFQNPYGSLNPRHTVGQILMEPLAAQGLGDEAGRRALGQAMLERVGLRAEAWDRWPHMFSGGQRQRIAIARALMLEPAVLVLDEPVSALDVSIRAQVLNLLADLQQVMRVAYVFISHDLSVVRHVADEVAVMYLGRIVELGPNEAVFSAPRHPYTQALLSATPSVDPAARRQRILLQGELPSPLSPPAGCAFHTRCRHAAERCRIEVPPLQAPHLGLTELKVACHLADDPQVRAAGERLAQFGAALPTARAAAAEAAAEATAPEVTAPEAASKADPDGGTRPAP